MTRPVGKACRTTLHPAVPCRRSTASLVLALLALGACSRDQADQVLVKEPPGGAAMQGLAPMDLKTHADFDRLDRYLSGQGAPGDALKIYEDLARVAPDNPRILFRAAFAGLTLDGTDRGRSVAAGVRARLGARAADDPDVQYLALLLDRSALAGDAVNPRVTPENSAAVKALADRAASFATAHPDWTGPMGLRADAVARLGAELADAVARAEAAPPPAAGPGSPQPPAPGHDDDQDGDE